MSAVAQGRYWSFPKKLTIDLSAFTVLVWIGFVIVISAISIGIDRWGNLNQSVWEHAWQIPPWFVLFMGVALATDHLPLQLTHGKTRRDFMIEASIFIGVFSAFAGLLQTLGWVVERGLYAVLDAEQRLEEQAIFASATDYPLIFLEAWIVMLIWCAAGLFIAASWYANNEEGLAAIIPALLIATIVEFSLGASWGPIGGLVRRLFDPDQPPLAITIAAGLLGLAALLAMTWRVVRTIPIRSTSA